MNVIEVVRIPQHHDVATNGVFVISIADFAEDRPAEHILRNSARTMEFDGFDHVRTHGLRWRGSGCGVEVFCTCENDAAALPQRQVATIKSLAIWIQANFKLQVVDEAWLIWFIPAWVGGISQGSYLSTTS